MNRNDMLYKVCALVGAGTLVSVGLGILSTIRYQLHRSNLQRYHHGKEPWVLITGASKFPNIHRGLVHFLKISR